VRGVVSPRAMVSGTMQCTTGAPRRSWALTRGPWLSLLCLVQQWPAFSGTGGARRPVPLLTLQTLGLTSACCLFRGGDARPLGRMVNGSGTNRVLGS
jgi:hypothetical protein